MGFSYVQLHYCLQFSHAQVAILFIHGSVAMKNIFVDQLWGDSVHSKK